MGTKVTGLRNFIRHLGLAKAAERLGVSNRTLTRWTALGVPESKAAAIGKYVARHQAAKKAAETKRLRGKAFRAPPIDVSLPPKQLRRGENLTPAQLLPHTEPSSQREIRAVYARLESLGELSEFETVTGTRGVMGWFNVGQSLLEWDTGAVIEHVRQVMRHAEGLISPGCEVRMALATWIPFNPHYKAAGMLRLVKLQGSFSTFFVSSGSCRTAEEAVNRCLNTSNNRKWNSSPMHQAQSRLVWVIAYEIRVYDRNIPT